MSDEYARNRWIVGETPTVPIGTVIELSGLNAHRIAPFRLFLRKWLPAVEQEAIPIGDIRPAVCE
jgi:hypothetical protein